MLTLLRSSLFLSGVLGAATLGRRDGLWQPAVGAKIQMMISGSPAVGSSVVPSDVVSFLSLGGNVLMLTLNQGHFRCRFV